MTSSEMSASASRQDLSSMTAEVAAAIATEEVVVTTTRMTIDMVADLVASSLAVAIRIASEKLMLKRRLRF